ncbi:hypothetical protein GZH47_32260 (plasmid) [Paenibacillus rhizovicinus]|uniref:Uncharacterized protein n=1 Tax=Paenibacillus rhizovicinus TaxID=2704463 RepID=A0A6C0PAE7_9BACL|nr:hypothetical protein [Paenibacillus rhizovicinus]QHW35560.1 hypothetical protein GZH47_32260 [Paenibacillus rhizovicinus]
MLNTAEKEKFAPLFLALARLDLTVIEQEESTANYMFMYQEDALYAYKHYWTRSYVYLDANGGIVRGVLDTGMYNNIIETLNETPAPSCFICTKESDSAYAGAPICLACESIMGQVQTTIPMTSLSEEVKRKMAVLIVRTYREE